MPDFGDEAMDRWLDSLPGDLRSAIEAGEGTRAPWDGDLADEISRRGNEVLADFPALAGRHLDAIRACGRARRIRMLSWIRAEAEGAGRILTTLTDPDGEGEGESSGDVGRVFLEDVRILMEVIGKRIALRMSAEASVEATVQSAMALEGQMTMAAGGRI